MTRVQHIQAHRPTTVQRLGNKIITYDTVKLLTHDAGAIIRKTLKMFKPPNFYTQCPQALTDEMNRTHWGGASAAYEEV